MNPMVARAARSSRVAVVGAERVDEPLTGNRAYAVTTSVAVVGAERVDEPAWPKSLVGYRADGPVAVVGAERVDEPGATAPGG